MEPPKQPVALIAVLPLVFAAWASTSAIHSPRSLSWGRHSYATSVHFSDTKITLDGASERPKPVKTDGMGTAKFSWSETSPISFTIEVTNLSSKPTGAHIHGPANSETATGVLFTLPLDSVIPNGRISTGTIELKDGVPISLDSLKHLIEKGLAYVNVHTEKNPGGEIRGQFKPR